MNNIIFGKTMENIRNRADIHYCTSDGAAGKLGAKPNFHYCTIFDESQMKKTKIFFYKPVYLVMCILDLSKTSMYKFYYDYIKSKYKDKAELSFTDTDSLMYEIESEDFYKDTNPDAEKWFDTSDIPRNHPSGNKSGVNKKVVGKFKDETRLKTMLEIVGLRSDSIPLRCSTTKKPKSVKASRNLVDKTTSFKNYKKCLFNY